MPASPIRPLTALGCALALASCGPRWRAQAFPTHPDLFRASLEQLRLGNPRNAIIGFERLTLELGLRDTLLPRSHYYLGMARMEAKEWLLAADAFTRLVASFPTDTLADDALLQSGRAYARMWPEPELDAAYGHSALAVLGTLVQDYPQSPLLAEAQAEIARVRGMLAEKDYLNGAHYLRRRAYHSGLIYLTDVIELYPDTRAARDAHLKIAESYRKIGYTEDLRDICAQALERYPQDGEIREACRGTTTAQPPGSKAPPPPARSPPPPDPRTHR
jgi:outer membrane protein assembly factor BamD